MGKYNNGDPISIRSLLENKIIIPDMQRDYCWGNNAWDTKGEKYIELVSSFLNNIYTLFEDYQNGIQNPVKLGMIYAYESNKGCIQLCDGQQRITTLFLLLGYLNRFTSNKYDKYLVLNKKDFIEPRLNYSVRESTLYFISDLVNYYFLDSKNNSYKVKDIVHQSWFFHEYDLDPSVNSILFALGIIEKWYEIIKVEVSALYDFILDKLEFIFYNLENRKNGEETYVTINTTGEPLTATENLKPILIGNVRDDFLRKKYSDQWEEREDWFWENRGTDITTDENLNRFFIWYWQIGLLQEKSWKKDEELEIDPREIFTKGTTLLNKNEEESSEKIRYNQFCDLDNIHSYFLSLKLFIILMKQDEELVLLMSQIFKADEYSLNVFTKKMNKDDVITFLLPVMAYLNKFPNHNLFNDFFRRLRKNYINTKRKIGNKIDWRHIIQIVEYSNSEEDVLNFDTLINEPHFKKIQNVEVGNWFDYDEQIKKKLKETNKQEIESWENHNDVKGDLSFLWKSLNNKEISFELAKHVWIQFEKLQSSLKESTVYDNKTSNNFRLFLVLINSSKICHIPRCNGINGVIFSRTDRKSNFDYFFDENFLKLIASKSLDKYFKNFIKTKLQEMNIFNYFKDSTSYDSSLMLKIWLILKTIIANNNNCLLSFYDDNGISIYENFEYNRYSKNYDYSLGNYICGYAIKSGFGKESYCWYANIERWNNIEWLNSPLFPDLFPFKSYFPYDFRTDSKEDVEKAINTTNRKLKALLKDYVES